MIKINGINLNYRDVGADNFGENPVILLHGYKQNNAVFFELEKFLLANNHRVILVDSRGHGLSEHGESPISIELMAKDVAGLMDELNIKSAAIIGYSDGGNIALQMAVDFPEHVSSIVVISGNARPDGFKSVVLFCIKFWKMIKIILNKSTDLMQLLISQPKISDLELCGIKARTLLIYGSYDIISRRHINKLTRIIPGAILRIIKSGHFNMVQKWSSYADKVESFIRGEL